MGKLRKSPAFGVVLFFALALVLSSYFAFASVQGESGLFRRIQIEAEAALLREEKSALEAEVAALRNKTRRLSDGYLDLDLLDQQARKILGMARADEVLVR